MTRIFDYRMRMGGVAWRIFTIDGKVKIYCCDGVENKSLSVRFSCDWNIQWFNLIVPESFVTCCLKSTGRLPTKNTRHLQFLCRMLKYALSFYSKFQSFKNFCLFSHFRSNPLTTDNYRSKLVKRSIRVSKERELSKSSRNFMHFAMFTTFAFSYIDLANNSVLRLPHGHDSQMGDYIISHDPLYSWYLQTAKV